MSTDQLRSAFHCWLYETQPQAATLIHSWENSHYRFPQAQMAWEAWKASRAVVLLKQKNSLIASLIEAIEGAGFTVSGPTNHAAAENGEPAWVCNARATIAEATSV